MGNNILLIIAGIILLYLAVTGKLPAIIAVLTSDKKDLEKVFKYA